MKGQGYHFNDEDVHVDHRLPVLSTPKELSIYCKFHSIYLRLFYIYTDSNQLVTWRHVDCRLN